MALDIEMIEREEQPALAVEARATVIGIPRVIGPAYHSIDQLMQARGLKMAAAPYTMYKNVDWSKSSKSKGLLGAIGMLFYKFDMEIGIPINKVSDGEDKIIATCIPAGRYLKVLHRGPYKTMNKTYEAIGEYVSREGLQLKDFTLEIYLNDPKEVGEEGLETELLIPLV